MRRGERIGKGRLSAVIQDGSLRTVSFAGHEVLRGLICPVRDTNWGTMPVQTDREKTGPDRYHRSFSGPGGLFSGHLDIRLPDESTLIATLELTFEADTMVNRVGFTLLHPIRDVAGRPMQIRHPDGQIEDGRFPRLISPRQPARDIASLRHHVGPVSVTIDLEGDVFEMEDQRNWSDASFKTYCRPLSLPTPYPVSAGQTIRQEVILSLNLSAQDDTSGTAVEPEIEATLPEVLLAWEQGLCSIASIAATSGIALLARIDAGTEDTALTKLAAHGRVAIEIVYDDLADLDRQIARIDATQLRPIRATALPRTYLRSHQPDGSWPGGHTPDAALPYLHAAFPGTAIGAGSLTNFTEFNRCPPRSTPDFLTFGNTANVHAADDQSIMETLEALPDIFASAQAILPGLPLHLGLFAIAMRTNPYGAAVQANPDGLCLPMAQDDPRQGTEFAATYAAAVLAQAARAGIGSIALAMTDGPLGQQGALAAFIGHAAALAGQRVRLTHAGHIFRVKAADGRGFQADTRLDGDVRPCLTLIGGSP